MNEFVEVLQEGSERVCGTALPIEIVLAILIETLQGEPVKTEFTTQAEAWEMYLRADRGEIM
jgi:hypothetical protein